MIVMTADQALQMQDSLRHAVDEIILRAPMPTRGLAPGETRIVVHEIAVDELRLLVPRFTVPRMTRIDDGPWWDATESHHSGHLPLFTARATVVALELAVKMTHELATIVHDLRYHKRASWRMVAESMHGLRAWARWEPSYNQCVGCEIVRQASRLVGEGCPYAECDWRSYRPTRRPE